MRALSFLAISACATLLSQSAPLPNTEPLPPKGEVKKIELKAGGKHVTSLLYTGYRKPLLFPLNGPGGVEMQRQWPVKSAAENEATDHPHHQSLWFTHGDVNGVDFWAMSEKSGSIVVKGEPKHETHPEGDRVTSQEEWRDANGQVVLTSSTTVAVGCEGEDRWIDYTITLTASEGKVTFGDTKEGTMAIRTRPELNLKGKGAAGTAVNSNGETGAGIWGKSAQWVDYSATVNGKTLGVACFDHPSNLRHPTTWHARDYGLIAANPFGLSDFQKKPKGTGDHTLEKGQSLTLKYRWLFHEGDAAAAKIAERWDKWAKSSSKP